MKKPFFLKQSTGDRWLSFKLHLGADSFTWAFYYLRTISNSKLPVREKVKAMKQIIHLLAAGAINRSPARLLTYLPANYFTIGGDAARRPWVSGTTGRRPPAHGSK